MNPVPTPAEVPHDDRSASAFKDRLKALKQDGPYLAEGGSEAPSLECDIVMKGGITSGIVYPLAICELASNYRFRNIGGTSAGAIAAASTAAAELGRARGRPGFARLAGLPEELGQSVTVHTPFGARKRSRLLTLFQPQAAFRTLFELAIQRGGMQTKADPADRDQPAPRARARNEVPLGGWVRAQLAPFGGRALLGFALGAGLSLALAAVIGVGPSWWQLGLCLLVAIAAGMIGGLAAATPAIARAALAAAKRVLDEGVNGHYGLCTGLETPSAGRDEGRVPALSTYFADLIDELAGVVPAAGQASAPVTFGDLWQHPDPPDPAGPAPNTAQDDPGLYTDLPREARAINLEMVTTCLSHGRPYTLPMPKAVARRFYFDPEELAQYLPERVVAFMVLKARPSETLQKLREAHPDDGLIQRLKALPEPRDWPVILAVRLSLSFPVLFAAVPLWAIDFDRAREEDRRPVRCWFSDGGLSSNFPLHLFDSPVPRRPTFAINLRPFPPDHARSAHDQSKNVSSPMRYTEGRNPMWRYFEEGDAAHSRSSLGKIAGFFDTVFNAVQNWSDGTLMQMPGYLERITHVSLEPSEGGLNLVMPKTKIVELAERGYWSVGPLLEKFLSQQPSQQPSEAPFKLEETNLETRRPPTEQGEPINWGTHRFVRVSLALSSLEETLAQLHAGYAEDPAAIERLIERTTLGLRTQAFFKAQLADLDRHAQAWNHSDASAEREDFERNTARPKPELRARPKL